MALTDTSVVNSNQTQTQSGNQSQNATNTNQYTAGQTGVQGMLGSLFSNMLGGQPAPSSYTQNPALMGAITSNFNQNLAPQLAFQGGAGTPQLASNLALQLQQATANQYNTGVSQYQNALGMGTNYALGNAIGASQASNGANTASGATNTDTTTQNPLALLQALIGAAGGTLASI